MKAFRALCFLVLSTLALHANAERVQVPLMNWENIPAGVSTAATVNPLDSVRLNLKRST